MPCNGSIPTYRDGPIFVCLLLLLRVGVGILPSRWLSLVVPNTGGWGGGGTTLGVEAVERYGNGEETTGEKW